MLRHPKWLKPLSVIIEVASIVIVVVVVWAILTAIKSLLAIWALGSCNVTKPSACSLGAEVCSIDEPEPQNPLEATGRWFTEWGEIFEAIPDKFRTYSAEDYNFNYILVGEGAAGKPIAVDIFDPGCSVCMVSYRNQKQAGFFDNYNVRLVPLAIQDADDSYKFKNSELIVRYIFAAEKVKPGVSVKLIDHIFTGKNHDGISYQNMFSDEYSEDEAKAKLESWLAADGATKNEIKKIREYLYDEEITNMMQENRNIIEHEVNVRGIPTMIYDGKRYTGLYKASE